jgi:hypothetical protein
MDIALQEEFELMLRSGEDSDFLIEYGNHHFPVHKFMISRKSPGFREMCRPGSRVITTIVPMTHSTLTNIRVGRPIKEIYIRCS